MTTYKIGYFVGSLAESSINRKLADAFVALAPESLELVEIPIKDLPLYSHDMDGDYPQVARDFKAAIESVDALLVITPEYNRGVPGGLKNAIDIASRPWGTNSFAGKPVAIAGASIGAVGTAVAQQQLRGIFGFLDTVIMGQPEAYIQLTAESFDAATGETSESLAGFLRGYLATFESFVVRHAEKPRDAYDETAA